MFLIFGSISWRMLPKGPQSVGDAASCSFVSIRGSEKSRTIARTKIGSRQPLASQDCEFKGLPNELARSIGLRISDLFRSGFRRTMVTNGNGVRSQRTHASTWLRDAWLIGDADRITSRWTEAASPDPIEATMSVAARSQPLSACWLKFPAEWNR